MGLQSKVIKHLKHKGAWCIKTMVVNERGCPDILACVNGTFWGIEIKAGTDRLSAIQYEQLLRISEAGGRAVVVADEPEPIRRQLVSFSTGSLPVTVMYLGRFKNVLK